MDIKAFLKKILSFDNIVALLGLSVFTFFFVIYWQVYYRGLLTSLIITTFIFTFLFVIVKKFRFKTTHKFTKYLETQPLGNFGTIAFPAMQFILYTNPEKVYIAGCDSAPTGHFAGTVLEANKRALTDGTYPKIVSQWKELKEFADFNYPDIKIVFSGGTCLSKAYNKIQRFSEDIDFRIHTERPFSRAEKKTFCNYILDVIDNPGGDDND